MKFDSLSLKSTNIYNNLSLTGCKKPMINFKSVKTPSFNMIKAAVVWWLNHGKAVRGV